jgi:superfamily II DNA or RNA helicase
VRACDLLNEGWDCPQEEVLFMARPTMLKVLTQQFDCGMRTEEGKNSRMVFNFVDSAGQYKITYSLHLLFKLSEYRAGGKSLGKFVRRKEHY